MTKGARIGTAAAVTAFAQPNFCGTCERVHTSIGLPAAIRSDMNENTESLLQRIALYRSHLQAGVAGALAIRYPRQIAEDQEALSKVLEPPDAAASARDCRYGAARNERTR